MDRQQVFVAGATGRTGQSIVDGLLESGNFTVIAGVRPSSESKPETKALQFRGVEIRLLDLDNWTVNQIAEAIKGTDTVISAVHYLAIPKQKGLADACKKSGVRRFVPCDWATACVPGVMDLCDRKLVIQDYVKEIGIGYTFIDVGWWMQLTAPFSGLNDFPIPVVLRARIGNGDVKYAVTDLRDIGKFVARIITDERTLNRYVFCWTQQVTQNEAIAIFENVTGSTVDAAPMTTEDVVKLVKDPPTPIDVDKFATEYAYSIWVRGDNTVENAKKEEYGNALDARELYPDIGKHLRTLEDLARESLRT